MRGIRTAIRAALAVAVLVSCSSHRPAPERATVPQSSSASLGARAHGPAGVTIGSKTRLSSAIARAHFAFRPDGDAWSMRDARFAARATIDGLTFTPLPDRGSLSFGAPQIARDAWIATPPPSITSTVRGGVVLDHGEHRASLVADEDGVEQSWTFSTRPRGSGDLVVRIPVAGAAFVGATAGGLHFRGEGEVGVRYGVATWIDASGA
ncbi:MAG: hypothetical protein ACHREM_23745, partial [Polyangiales bacterium]